MLPAKKKTQLRLVVRTRRLPSVTCLLWLSLLRWVRRQAPRRIFSLKEGSSVVQTRAKLTVYFEDPFWVGLYERWEDGRVEVCKITFGAEPKDYQVYERMLAGWDRLRFSPPVAGEAPAGDRRVNPKRMQRVIRRALEGRGNGTKAQQALQLQREAGKKERRTFTRQQREAERERQFALRQEKRREKHRGH